MCYQDFNWHLCQHSVPNGYFLICNIALSRKTTCQTTQPRYQSLPVICNSCQQQEWQRQALLEQKRHHYQLEQERQLYQAQQERQYQYQLEQERQEQSRVKEDQARQYQYQLDQERQEESRAAEEQERHHYLREQERQYQYQLEQERQKLSRLKEEQELQCQYQLEQERLEQTRVEEEQRKHDNEREYGFHIEGWNFDRPVTDEEIAEALSEYLRGDWTDAVV